MTVAVYLPLLLALPLFWAAPRLTRGGSPALAARALTAVAAVAGFATVWSLGLLALTLLDDVPPLRTLDNHPVLEPPEPVPGPIALVAALLLLGGAARLAVDLHRRLGTVRRLRAVGRPRAGLVVADLPAPMAVAVPGRPGHLLVTTGILRLLGPRERRVLFAHERAHLRHRHSALVMVAAAAAKVNPLLAPAREAVGYLVERWADEYAAAEVGDRDLTAQAVARAALGTVPTWPALGIDGGVAVRRVRALAEPAPSPRRGRLAGLVVLAVAFTATMAVATIAFVGLARAWL
ncbi:M56 family metallopeptidase [Paractinoplanes durhamensis]|uniref:M56 family metallopeptidase n=1 Tax=Paractinoplanes durhamensis TaxID=113563 RepID=UPI0031DEF531